MARKLIVEIVGDSSSLERALNRATGSSSRLGGSLKSLGRVAAIGVGAAFAGLAVVVKRGFDEIGDGQRVAAQTAATLKSTGGIANVTAKQVDALAQSQSKLTGIDDELIQTGSNLLLTFKNVRNEVGKGNAVFDQATKSALNLSTAGFGSVESASKMLGKALNDPVKGMTALGRAGVTFSEDQKKAITEMVKTNDLLGAQKLILKEVESQVGGSAKAFGETMPGQLSKLRNSFEEVAAQVATVLLPYLMRLVDWTNDHMPEIQRVIETVLNAVIGTIQFLAPIIATLIGWFQRLYEAAQKYWPPIQAVIQGVINWFRTNIVPTVAAVVNALIALWQRFGDEIMAVVRPVFTIILTIITTTMRNIRAAIEIVMALIRGDWGKAWEALKSLVSNTLNGIKAIIIAVLTGLVPAVLGLALSIGKAIVGGIARGLASLVSVGLAQLQKLPGILSGIAGQAAGWAVSIGQAIVSGILSGVGGLFGALKSKLEGTLRSVLSSLSPFSSVEHGGEIHIGKPIVEGAVKGVEANASKLETALAAKVREAVENAKQAVDTARGDFASAFGELASTALQAFDAVVSAWKSPAQIKLDSMNLKQQIADLKTAITEGAAGVASAQAELSAAQVGADPTAIASAQAAVLQAQKTHNDALVAQEEFLLSQRAAKQQAAHDKKMARQRLQLQEELSDLQVWLAKHPGEYEKVQGKIGTLLKQQGIDAKFWGSAVGISLAAGLSEAEGAVRKAAAAIAKAIARYLKLKSPAEEGELADLDKWWGSFGDTLVAGLNLEAVHKAGAAIASAAKRGLDEGTQALKTLTLGTNEIGITLPPPDVVPTTEALDVVAASVDVATSHVVAFRDTITALPGFATQAFTALTAMILKAVAPLPKALDPARAALQEVANALHSIGRAAYATRAALQDTVEDIIRLLGRIGGPGSLRGLAGGGSVRAGEAVIVGETGPELFIPKQSGTIVAGSANLGAAVGVGNITINFPNYVGSRQELVAEVRRGLYDVSRRNPGALPGIA